MCTSIKAAEIGQIVKGLLPAVTSAQLDVITAAVDERLRSEHRTANQYATLYALEDALFDLKDVIGAVDRMKERMARIRKDIGEEDL